jgi:hypothetical protein
MDDEATEVVHRAERIVWVAGWRWQEDCMLRQLAGTRGLACARLEPRSEVIQLVTYDGEHLGHVRREGRPGHGGRWVAVPKGDRPRDGVYASAMAAAVALAEACGKIINPG